MKPKCGKLWSDFSLSLDNEKVKKKVEESNNKSLEAFKEYKT